MQQTEDRVLNALIAALDLAIEGKTSAKEAMDAIKASLDGSLEDPVRDREAWMFAEGRAGALFELYDQDLEFLGKVKWHSVECLISCIILLNKIRLRLATKGACSEAIKRWLSSVTYECNVIFRFCKDGVLHEKQAAFLKEVLHSTWTDFVFLCSSFERKEDANEGRDTQVPSKSLELLSIIGVNQEALKILKPEPSFIRFVPYFRDYKLIFELLDLLAVCQFTLEVSQIKGLGELIVSLFLLRKYQGRNLHKENQIEILTSEFVIKACDKLIIENQADHNSKDNFILYKTFLEAIDPFNINLGERLECLYKIKTGDFKELLKYKQSLNLSNPADILFDLLIDLFRMSLPTTSAAPSVAVLLHKLSTPGVSSLLTNDLMLSCKQYFQGANSFPYVLLLHASIGYNSQLVGTFLRGVVDWCAWVRERIRHNQHMQPIVREFFTQVGLHKAESIVIRDGRVALPEHRGQLLKCSYLCFYLAKYIESRQEAASCLQLLFKVAEGVDNLWTLNEESGAFFVDIIQILLPETSAEGKEPADSHQMDIESEGHAQEVAAIVGFIALLATKQENDSPRVRAFKSILLLKLDLAKRIDSSQFDRREATEAVFNTLTFDEISSCLKTELASAAVYYTFFFNAIGNYLETGVDDPAAIRNLAQLMVYLYEEMARGPEHPQKRSATTVFPVLCQKIYPLMEGVLDRSTGGRLAAHLFNIWVDQRELSLIELAFKVAGGMKSNYKLIIAAYLFELAKAGGLEKASKEFHSQIDMWLDSELKIASHQPDSLAPQNQPQSSGLSVKNQQTDQGMLEELNQLEQEMMEKGGLGLCLASSLSRSQLLYVKLVNSFYQDPDGSSSSFGNFLSKEGNKLTEDEYAALLYATSSLPDKSLQSQLLRHYLSKLLSSGESATGKLLEIYIALLESTDSVRELKTYLIQMEGVVEMANPLGNPITAADLKSLVLQLAKVKADFQSLTDQISRVGNSIEKKWGSLCASVKGLDRMLAYIKEGLPAH